MQEEAEKESVRKINSFGIIIAFLLVFILPFFHFWLMPDPRINIGIIVYASLNALAVYINMKSRYHTLAAFILFLLQAAATVYFSWLVGKDLQLHFMAFLLIAMANQIFTKKLNRDICFGLSILMLFALELLYHESRPVIHFRDEKIMLIIKFIAITNIIVILYITSRSYLNSKETNDKLARANRFIKNFVAHVTHEMRSPLNSIGLLAASIKQEITRIPDLKPLENHVDMLMIGTSNALNIINNVQDLAQVEAGITDNRNVEKTFSLKSFFSELIQTAAIYAETKDIRIRLLIEDMPALITSDAIKLSHILNNLLSNAIKYGLKNSTITVRLSGEGSDHWTIEVRNATRNSIPPEKLALLFDHPFISNRNSDSESTGLGLYIVNLKVRSMGGTVKLTSPCDSQMVCTVRLPLKVGTPRDLDREKDNTVQNEPDDDIVNTRVLIAEDEAINARALSVHLEQMGCQTEIAENGSELIRKASKGKFDIIIMDYHMPLMNGEAAMRYLKDDPMLKNIPIIVTTGEASSESLDRLLAAGADDYIPKPIQQQPLRMAITRSKLRMQLKLSQEGTTL